MTIPHKKKRRKREFFFENMMKKVTKDSTLGENWNINQRADKRRENKEKE